MLLLAKLLSGSIFCIFLDEKEGKGKGHNIKWPIQGHVESINGRFITNLIIGRKDVKAQ